MSLEDALQARERRLCVDYANETAILPVFCDASISFPSALAFVAFHVLTALAKANEETVWHVYGDIISSWAGPVSPDARRTLQAEREWVQQFRSDRSVGDELSQTVARIRAALAATDIVLARDEDLSDFVVYTCGELPEEKMKDEIDFIKHTLAFHHRSDKGENTIYVPSYLPIVESYIHDKFISPESFDANMAAAVVSMGKAMVHESRQLVGTLLHGATYRTPTLGQGSFPSPIPAGGAQERHEEPSGASGDYYEVTRYGAVLTPALVCPQDGGKPDKTTFVITGRMSANSPLRFLRPYHITYLAKTVRDGSFIETRRFFINEHTQPVLGYVLEVDEVFKKPASDHPLSPQPQSSTRQSMTARHCGPYVPQAVRGTPVESIRTLEDLRRVGYTNYPGVLGVGRHKSKKSV
ncbi:hypothetical protein B0H11DRAFT_2094122 [Mycena galericulata]|nr:hypothetical protein B0H11DRAFT_2094122 [Mycena galericulata]